MLMYNNPGLRKASENPVVKGVNAGNQYYLLFPQCFLSLAEPIQFSATFILFVNVFSLDQSKILLFGKWLNLLVNNII